MSRKRASEITVLAFMKAVYPDAGHLALGSFSEETVLGDARLRIDGLCTEITKLRRTLQQIMGELMSGRPDGAYEGAKNAWEGNFHLNEDPEDGKDC